MANEVSTIVNRPTKVDRVIGEILPSQDRDAIFEVLPRHIKPERFQQSLHMALISTPDLLDANPRHILREVQKVVSLGLLLDPHLGEAYLIMAWNAKSRAKEPQIRIGYKGLMKLAKQSGEIRGLYAHEVHKNDDLIVELGGEKRLSHKPQLFTDRGEIVGYYAVVRYASGEIDFEPMSVQQIHEIRDRTDAWKAFKDGKIKSTPWSTDEVEMAKKTVLRRLVKRVSISSELNQAFAIEDRAEFPQFERAGQIEAPPRAPAISSAQAEAPPRAPAATSTTPIADTFVETENELLTEAGAFKDLDEKTKVARTVDQAASLPVQDAEIVQDVEEAFDPQEMLASVADMLATTKTLSDVEDVANLYSEDRARLDAETQGELDALIAEARAKMEAGSEGQLPVEAATPFDEHIKDEEAPAPDRNPFEIPHVFKGGGHYTIWIDRICKAATDPNDRKILLECWAETKVDREELFDNGQLTEKDLERLKQYVTDKSNELKGVPPAEAQTTSQRAAAALDKPAYPAPLTAGPAAIAAYEARLKDFLGKAKSPEEIEAWWKNGEEDRNLTGATRQQRIVWRDLQRKAREELSGV